MPAAASLRCAGASGLTFGAPTGGGRALVGHRPTPDGGASRHESSRLCRPVAPDDTRRRDGQSAGAALAIVASLVEGDHAGSTTWALTPPVARTAPQDGIKARGFLEGAAVPLGLAAQTNLTRWRSLNPASRSPRSPSTDGTRPLQAASIQRRPFADLGYHASDRARARGGGWASLVGLSSSAGTPRSGSPESCARFAQRRDDRRRAFMGGTT